MFAFENTPSELTAEEFSKFLTTDCISDEEYRKLILSDYDQASLSASCCEIIDDEEDKKRPTKEKCEYCGGITFDDSRGSCMACGAPRKQPQSRSYARLISN